MLKVIIKSNGQSIMRATIQDMRLFVAVYEKRSFTAAAAREGATQSGVSQHIGKLEELLGVRLFTRSKASISATPAGGRLLHSVCRGPKITRIRPFRLSRYSVGLKGEIRVGLMRQ